MFSSPSRPRLVGHELPGADDRRQELIRPGAVATENQIHRFAFAHFLLGLVVVLADDEVDGKIQHPGLVSREYF